MQQHKGFSLLELIIVIAILGILSTVGLLTIRRDTPQVRQAASIIAADLMRARTEAIRLNTPVTFKVNAGADSYSMFADSDCDGTADTGTTNIAERTTTGDFPLADVETTLTNARICFDVRGLPRNNATGSISVTSRQVSSTRLSVNISSQGQVEVN